MLRKFKIAKNERDILKKLEIIFIDNNIEKSAVRFLDTELDITREILDNYKRIDKIEILEKCDVHININKVSIADIHLDVEIIHDGKALKHCRLCKIRHECPINYYLTNPINNIIGNYSNEYTKRKNGVENYVDNAILSDVIKLLKSRKNETVDLFTEAGIPASTYEKVIEILFRP